MNRFAKIMQVLGWCGVGLLAVVWGQGFFVRDDAPQLARHSTIALAAAALCILPRFWTAAYLVLAARGRAARRRAAGSAAPAPERSARLRRRAYAAAAIALVGLSGSFVLAGALLLRRASPLAHAAAGILSVAVQVAALMLERRALLADAAEMAEMPEMQQPDGSGAPARSGS